MKRCLVEEPTSVAPHFRSHAPSARAPGTEGAERSAPYQNRCRRLFVDDRYRTAHPTGLGFLAALAVEAILASFGGVFSRFAIVRSVFAEIDAPALVHIAHAGVVPVAYLRAVSGAFDFILYFVAVIATGDRYKQG